MPNVVKAGKKPKEFAYSPEGMAAAEKMAKETGGKVKMPKNFKKGDGKKR